VLWRAGQERETREQKDRLVEAFVAGRDAALDALVNSGQVKAKGPWRLPSYVRRESTQQRTGSPVERDATLAKLGVMFPGMVKRSDS
jgi:hypothetical protein